MSKKKTAKAAPRYRSEQQARDVTKIVKLLLDFAAEDNYEYISSETLGKAVKAYTELTDTANTTPEIVGETYRWRD